MALAFEIRHRFVVGNLFERLVKLTDRVEVWRCLHGDNLVGLGVKSLNCIGRPDRDGENDAVSSGLPDLSERRDGSRSCGESVVHDYYALALQVRRFVGSSVAFELRCRGLRL